MFVSCDWENNRKMHRISEQGSVKALRGVIGLWAHELTAKAAFSALRI